MSNTRACSDPSRLFCAQPRLCEYCALDGVDGLVDCIAPRRLNAY